MSATIIKFIFNLLLLLFFFFFLLTTRKSGKNFKLFLSSLYISQSNESEIKVNFDISFDFSSKYKDLDPNISPFPKLSYSIFKKKKQNSLIHLLKKEIKFCCYFNLNQFYKKNKASLKAFQLELFHKALNHYYYYCTYFLNLKNFWQMYFWNFILIF